MLSLAVFRSTRPTGKPGYVSKSGEFEYELQDARQEKRSVKHFGTRAQLLREQLAHVDESYVHFP